MAMSNKVISIFAVVIMATVGLMTISIFSEEEKGYIYTEDLYYFAIPGNTISVYSPQGSDGYTGDPWVTGLPSGMTSAGVQTSKVLINVGSNVPLWQEYVVSVHRIVGGVEYTRNAHILTNNVSNDGRWDYHTSDLGITTVGQYISKNWDFASWEDYISSTATSTVPGMSDTYNSSSRLYYIQGTPTSPGLYAVEGTFFNTSAEEEGGFEIYVFVKNPSYSHTITYNGNGATSGSVANTVATDTNSGNSNVTLASNGFYRAGYTFAGWSVGGVTYQPGTAISVGGNQTVTAYAVWSENTLTASAGNGEALSNGSVNVQINAVANNGATLSYAIKSCSAGSATVSGGGLVSFKAPTVSSTTYCNVVATVTATYPGGQTKAVDCAFTVMVDPVGLIFTNSITDGSLTIKGAA